MYGPGRGGPGPYMWMVSRRCHRPAAGSVAPAAPDRVAGCHEGAGETGSDAGGTFHGLRGHREDERGRMAGRRPVAVPAWSGVNPGGRAARRTDCSTRAAIGRALAGAIRPRRTPGGRVRPPPRPLTAGSGRGGAATEGRLRDRGSGLPAACRTTPAERCESDARLGGSGHRASGPGAERRPVGTPSRRARREADGRLTFRERLTARRSPVRLAAGARVDHGNSGSGLPGVVADGDRGVPVLDEEPEGGAEDRRPRSGGGLGRAVAVEPPADGQAVAVLRRKRSPVATRPTAKNPAAQAKAVV